LSPNIHRVLPDTTEQLGALRAGRLDEFLAAFGALTSGGERFNLIGIEVKICGLTRRDDAAAALDLGADYIGFVLFARSPRCIEAKKLARLLDGIPGPCKAIGVFVNESRKHIEKVASDCGLFAVQLNGNEPVMDFSGMTMPLWRSMSFQTGVRSIRPQDWLADRYVVDSVVPGKFGGTGRTADWKQAALFARKHQTMLAGGLTPENVAEAIRATRPTGVDVSSGVERDPRMKNRAKMAAFIENAKKCGVST